MQKCNWPRVICGAVAMLAGANVDPVEAKDIIIHAGRLIDGISPAPGQRMSIIVRDDRIVGIEKGFITREGAEVIDLSQATVLPGLIEGHDHIATSGSSSPFTDLTMLSEGDETVNAIINARKELEWGFTATRDLSSNMVSAPAVRRAIEKGRVIGPRIWTSLEALGPTGGHSDIENGFRPGLQMPGRDSGIISGPDSAIEQVRMHRRLGATVIKIMVSGGVISVGDDPNAKTLTDAEVKAVVEAAHALGLKVAAHAHGKAAIDRAVLAGVDSIEHGTFADAESLRLMKARGVFMIPTMLSKEEVLNTARTHPEKLSPGVAAKVLSLEKQLGPEHVTRAYRAGVTIVFGSDTSAQKPGRLKAEQFELMVKAGMAPMDVIFSATRNAAQMLGAAQDIGSVQAGRFADIIAVTGDPLADISELERVAFVMKGGEVIKAGSKMIK